MNNTKKEIIEKAHGLFLICGYKNTSIDTIIQEVGISKGAFFYHFKDKKVLFLEVMDYFFYESAPSELYDILSKKIASREDVIESCKVLWKSFVKAGYMGGCLLGNMTLELSDIDEFFRKKLMEIYIKWEDGIVEHIERIPDFVPQKKPREIAQFIIYSMEGLNMKGKVFKDHQRMQKEFDLFIETLDYIL